jgi:hypothetical protein
LKRVVTMFAALLSMMLGAVVMVQVLLGGSAP